MELINFAAFAPTAINSQSSPKDIIFLKRFVFRAPHKPLSVEKTIISLGRDSSRAKKYSPNFSSNFGSSMSIKSIKSKV